MDGSMIRVILGTITGIGTLTGGLTLAETLGNYLPKPKTSHLAVSGILSARLSVLGYLVCMDQLVQLGVHSLARSLK